VRVTQIINGGQNRLADRNSRYNKARAALQI
ncbi:glycoside hydrolase family 19 protein, partial [Salmonella enterica subsp. diarizonae]|nr:glycoside hydrolase family 19 protein [Salmonella enterica subsp. diarizonae]